MAEIVPASEDLFFDEVVRGYVEGNRRFVRRPWLADIVEKSLSLRNRSFILITAEPGAGKSTFLAQLAHHHPNWLRYFIRRDQRSVLADVSAKSLLLRIGCQLAACQPALFSLEQLSISVEQRIGKVADRGEAVGVEIERLIASPFYRQVFYIKQHVRANRGVAVGLRVQELVADTRLLNTEELMHLALLDPARALQRIDPTQRIVVLVDALDEIYHHSAAENILDWLTNCPALPENVRFVLTSRPPDERLEFFCTKQRPNLTELVITGDDPEVKQDSERFVEKLVAEGTLARTFQDTKGAETTFTQKILVKAHGNLGYLDAIARAIDQAVREDDILKLQALLNLNELPADLEGLYAFFLGQIKVAVARDRIELRDHDSGEAYHIDVWPAVYVRILGVLAVATEPLSLEHIERLGQIRAERSWTIQALEHLLQFLEIKPGRYRFYHTTVAEFLTDPRIVENPETAFLYQNPQRWHLRISEEYWQYHSNWAACDAYGLRNLAMHMSLSGQTDRLLALLDMKWMQVRYERSGYSHEGFLADVEVAQTCLTAHNALTVARLTQLESMRHTLRDLAEDLTDEDVEILALLGRESEALAHVRLRRTTTAQCQGILKIHKVALKANEETALLLEDAERLAQVIHLGYDRSVAFLEIAEAHVEEPDVSKAIFDKALKSIKSIADSQQRWRAFRNAINCLVRCEFFSDAEQLLNTFARDVERTVTLTTQGKYLGGDSELADATSELVNGLAERGYDERAEDLIAALKDPAKAVSCLATLSMIRAKNGDIRALMNAGEAYEIASQHPYNRDDTFRASATALRRCDDPRANIAFNRALEEARRHPEPADRAIALSNLARDFYSADPARALTVFTEATAVAREDRFQHGQQRGLESIALNLFSIGEYDSALETAALVAEPEARTKLLVRLDAVEGKSCIALDMALAAFDLVADNSNRVAVGRLLTLSLARARDPRAAVMFRTVQEQMKLVSSGEFGWALAQWAPVFARAGQIERAKQIAKSITVDLARMEALEKSISAISVLDNVEGVKTLTLELENLNRSVVVLVNFAFVLATSGSSNAGEVFERAATMARSLPESCARAEATSYIALCLRALQDSNAAKMFDEAYREALDQQHWGKLFSRDRLNQTALRFALVGRDEEAKHILHSLGADSAGGDGVREIVGALARRGHIRSACQYADFIDRDKLPVFFSQYDWALFDIAAALAEVGRFKAAERILDGIRLPDARVRGLCVLALKLRSVDPVIADATFRKAVDVAGSLRRSIHSAEAVFIHLCIDLYRADAREAGFVLDETIAAIIEGSNYDRDRWFHEFTAGLCELGQFDAARRVARLITDPEWRDSTAQVVANGLAYGGKFEEARAELEYISSTEVREWAMHSLATSYAAAGRFNEAEEMTFLIDNPTVSASLYCEMGLIASQKASDRATEFFDKMSNLLTRVDDQETILRLAKNLASAGKPLDAITTLSRCGLDNFLGFIGELAPLLQEGDARASAAILENAAGIAGWARQDWRAVSLLLQAHR